MNASGELAADIKAGQADFDLEDLFRAQYRHIADVIARVVRDPARAEELAVEVFLKLSRNRKAQGENALGACPINATRTTRIPGFPVARNLGDPTLIDWARRRLLQDHLDRQF